MTKLTESAIEVRVAPISASVIGGMLSRQMRTITLVLIVPTRAQISTLEKLRDTLLPKLMSGEVRVKV